MQKQKTLAYYTIFKCSFAALTTHMGLSRLPKLKPKGGLFSRASSAVVAVEKAAAFINCNELKRWGKERKEKRSSELIWHSKPSFACQRFVTQFFASSWTAKFVGLQQDDAEKDFLHHKQWEATFAFYILDTKVEKSSEKRDILQHFASSSKQQQQRQHQGYRKLKPCKVPFHAPNIAAKTNIYVRGTSREEKKVLCYFWRKVASWLLLYYYYNTASQLRR